MSNEERIELHARFFAEERAAIRNLSDEEMNERREEFRKIAFEAKARLTAHDAEERERNAKRSVSQKEWLLSPNGPDPNISDALTATKERKARQTKADKQKATLEFLGLANADQIVAKIAAANTGRAITSAPVSANPKPLRDTKPQTTSAFCLNNAHHNCNGSFMIAETKESKPCDCKCHKPKVTFNPAQLFNKK